METRQDGNRWYGARSLTRGAALVVAGGLIGGGVAVAHNAEAQGTGAAVATNRLAAYAPTSIEQTREAAIKKVAPAIVEVQTNSGLGSGVEITKDGYIVTNNHVVAGARQVQVVLNNGKTVSATVKGTTSVLDLAVIKINDGSNLPTVSYADSSQLTVGQSALAIGNPLGIVSTVTDGIVSAVHRVIQEGQNSQGRIYNAVQTSAPINPGNSGGALIDLSGRLIGIPTLTAVDPQFNAPANGVGFAIPSNTVNNIASQIIQYGTVKHSGIAALGTSAVTVTPQAAQQNNLPVSQGVLIGAVSANGAAAKAGLRKGDIITQIDGTDIASFETLLTILGQKKPGDTISVTAYAPQGGKKTYKVTLGELNVNG